MGLNLRPNIRPYFYLKKFGPRFLSRVDLHVVRPTEVDVMFTLYFSSTATTIPIARKARTEYDSGHASDGDEAIIVYLFTVSLTIWKPIQDKTFGLNFIPNRLPYGKVYNACRHVHIMFCSTAATVPMAREAQTE